MDSLSTYNNYKMVFKAGQGAGASGSFFFFSYDNKFIIKTLQGEERVKILSMIQDYVKYIKSTENRSLIARIYGVFTVKTDQFKSIDVMVMQNTAKLDYKKGKSYIFDLKGSTIDRKVIFDPSQKMPVLKD